MYPDFRQHLSEVLFRGLLILATIAGLAACSKPLEHRSSSANLIPDWGYSDLRALDPPDTSLPAQDLLAIYLSQNPTLRGWLDIRLDFLESPVLPDENIWVAIDIMPGGRVTLPAGASADIFWDALVILPANAPFLAVNSQLQPLEGLSIRVLHDPEQDSLQISLDAASLYDLTGMGIPPGLKIQAFSTATDGNQIMDRTPIAVLNAPAPQPVKLMLAFWNTFPAYSPAQALRRWDGAHTGLFGGRNGLYNLLRAARNYSIPVLLLDLKIPAWLSAMDYAGDIDLVKELIASRLALAPDVWMADQGAGQADYSVMLAESYGFPSTVTAYAQDIYSLPVKYQLVFTPSTADLPFSSVRRRASLRVVPIPLEALQNNTALYLDPHGLSLNSRRLLAATVADASSNRSIFILGGDLSQSGWGSPEAVRQAFAYLKNHPWIQLINPHDLMSFPIDAPYELSSNPKPTSTGIPFNDPILLGSDPLTQAAAQSAFASPVDFNYSLDGLDMLRTIYGPQQKILLTAAKWAKNPAPVASCNYDLDEDGTPECILANEAIYTVYDLKLGVLTHAFVMGSDGPHQWIAPSSQLTYGTSDPSTWDLSAGVEADPTVIPGAFAEPSAIQTPSYQAQIQPGKLSLIRSDGEILKTFTLQDNHLQVKLNGITSTTTRLPLVVDPWLRFQPDWWEVYQSQTDGGSITWGTDDIQIHIASPNTLTLSAFNDTRQLMGRVENPNTEYPPGHYLPFPMALVEAGGDTESEFRITLMTK